MNIEIDNIEALPQVAKRLLDVFPKQRFFALYGKMGVGKTTLIKAICKELGVEQNVCSPTFSIVNEYSTADNVPVYHFDFYRLRNLEEVYDIGYEEYFYSDGFCFTEWTEKIEPLLPDNYVAVEITTVGDKRLFNAQIVTQ